MTTGERIASVLTRRVCVDAALIMPSATAVSLKLDSLDQVEFAVELELEFKIDFPDAFFEKISTLGELEFEIEKFTALHKRVRAA